MASALRRRGARGLASAGFLMLIVGITYFGILVTSVRVSERESERAAYMVDLGDFLGGRGEWYADARTYAAGALLFALLSLLFETHTLARITLPIAASLVIILQFYGDELRELVAAWARL